MTLGISAFIALTLFSILCANRAERLHLMELAARDWSEVHPPEVPFE